MKTQDIKVNGEYIYKDDIVIVVKRIPGRETVQRNMQSGVLFTGYKREQKRFELSNGKKVYAKELAINK